MARKPATNVRLTLEVTADLNDRLDELAADCGGSKSELFRKAIALIELAIVAKREGSEIAVVDKDQRVVTTVVGL